MSTRKSLPRQLSRLSQYSIKSQISAVLDPDSNVNSGDEGQPLWFREFHNNSLNIRPSARFSLAQNDTPILDSDSEPDTTPLDKSWWKHLENTPDVRQRKSRSNVSKDKSNSNEKSNLESSDTSSIDRVVVRQRIALRHNKRKSLQRNVFSEILDSERPSASFNRSTQHTSKTQENQDDTNISFSDTDRSIEKVRKLPFKKRKKSKIVTKSTNTSAMSDTSGPDIFKKVLDASQSSSDDQYRTMGRREPEILPRNQETDIPDSQNIAETVRLEREEPTSNNRQTSANESDDTALGEDDSERSRSPVLMSRLKKRTIFTKTVNRRTANFDELLNNITEDEEIVDKSLDEGELESERIEKQNEKPSAQPSPQSHLHSNIADEEEDSDSGESIKKQRVPFPRKKRNVSPQEKIFPQLLRSLNTSVHSEPSTSQNKTGELEASRQDIPVSGVERGSSKRRRLLPEISGNSNLQLGENQSARKLSRLSRGTNESQQLGEYQSARKLSRLSRGTNESQPQRRSLNEIRDQTEAPGLTNVSIEENPSANIPNRSISMEDQSDAEKCSMNKESDLQGSSDPNSDIELEEDESLGTPIHQSTMRNKSGAQRYSVNRKNDCTDSSVPSIDEVEEHQLENEQNRPSSSSNRSAVERRSMNEGKGGTETSTSSSTEREKDELVDTPIPISVSFKKSRHPNKTTSLSNQMRLENNSRRVTNKSMNKELQVESAADGEDDEEDEIFKSAEARPNKTQDRSIDRSKSQNASKVDSTEVTDTPIRRSVSFKQSSDPNQSKRSLSRSQVQNNSPSVSEKSIINQFDKEFIDGEEEEDFGTVENFPNRSQDRSKAGTLRQDASRVDNNGSVGRRRTGSRSKSRSKVMLGFEEEVCAQEELPGSEGASHRSIVAERTENTGNGELRSTDDGILAPSVRNGIGASFLFADNEGARSVQRSELTLRGGGTQGVSVEKLTEIKNALEVVRKKEQARMKNSKIDSYFKKVSATESENIAKDSQRLPNKKKPMINRSKTSTATSPSKAYLVNGKIYQRPKLPRPKPWATDRLYNYLWKKMEPKYKLRTRIRSEKFIVYMSQITALVVRRKKFDNYKDEMNNLIREMAHLNIIKTRNDFNIFCQKFLPYEFRIKVIPMLLPGSVRNIPFEPHKMITPILE